MLKITATKSQGLDSRLVKTTLDSNGVIYKNFTFKFDKCTFEISKETETSDAFYTACILLAAIYRIKLKHPNILTVESMLNKLAVKFLQE